ncbi:MAG: hypothetical protein KIT84_23725 [Labilithrix sp.]|nr:hypothetical protein [Labilithrix sp.]MCW5814058.1 hypothetical protein [Labilithrix sp.]
MSSRLLLTSFLFSAIAVAACTAPADETGTSEARQTEVKALTAVKGREYARCWFDVVGADARLSCTSTARGEDPLGATVKVVAASMISPTVTPIGTTLDVEAGGTVVVGSLPRSAFPVMILLDAQLSGEAIKAVGLRKTPGWSNNVKHQRPEDLPASRPQTIGQPFDLWPVAFIDARREGSFFGVNTREYKRALAPYTAFIEPHELTLAPSFVTRDFQGKPTWWIAPASGGIQIDVHSGAGPDVTITGPGYYALTRDGFGPATPEQIARDFGAAKPEPTEPGATEPGTTKPGTEPTEPEPTEPTEPEPTEPEPVDPTPTCGGEAQAVCADNSCDGGHRLESDKCTACGAAGKTYCFVDPKGTNRNSAWRCDAATRLEGNTCVACGDAGQTYCFTDPNNTNRSSAWKCNAGTRLEGNTCVACGDAGQTYCFTDPNNTNRSSAWKCNAGTRLEGSSCITCGGEGETYCYSDPNGTNRSSAWKCDAGLTVKNGKCER